MRFLIAAVALVAITGCGVAYRSSSVQVAAGTDAAVQVIPMTSASVAEANRSAYTPKSLPAVFSTTAGAGSGLRSAGALPEPVLTPAAPPGRLALRLPSPVDPGPYRIGIGDVLLFSTPGNGGAIDDVAGLIAAQSARQGFAVQDDGAINIPKLGRVIVADMTVEAAEAALFQRLVAQQMDPAFSLEMAEFKARRVSVGGAVGTPTVVPLTLTPLHLDQALAAAGGITVADQEAASVRIYRAGKLYQIPLTTLYTRPELLKTRLIDGDAVFVDKAYDLSRAQAYFEHQLSLVTARQDARQAALDALETEINLRRAQLEEARQTYREALDLGADNNDYVYLTGEVRTQSRFALPFGRRANLADALFSDARGIDVETGDISQIYVLRQTEAPGQDRQVSAWHLDTRNAVNLTLATRFELRPNDVIFVAQQPITTWNRAVSQIVPSLINVTRVATVD